MVRGPFIGQEGEDEEVILFGPLDIVWLDVCSAGAYTMYIIIIVQGL